MVKIVVEVNNIDINSVVISDDSATTKLWKTYEYDPNNKFIVVKVAEQEWVGARFAMGVKKPASA